jgi:phage-related protein
MATALPLPDRISPESGFEVESRAITNSFGDGYEQSAPDGLNANIEMWDIVYQNVSETEKNTILTALNVEGTWGVLTWTPFDQAVEKKYKRDGNYKVQYSLTAESRRRYIISFKLKQRFDL